MVVAAGGVLLDPGPLLVVVHLAARVEDAAFARVEHDEPRAADVAAVAPDRAALGAVGVARLAPEQLPGVVGLEHFGQEPAPVDLGGGEVPDVLVDPVRDERTLDPLLPPRLAVHLVAPRFGD